MRFSIFIAVAVVVSLAIAPIGAAAVVQEDATNATDEQDALEDEIESNLSDDDVKEVIDSTLVITDWQFEDDTFTLTFRATQEQEIAIAEAIRADEGTGRMTWQTHQIEEGNQTIDVPVRTNPGWTTRGAAVMIASDESREAGHASYVSSGMIEPPREPVDYQIVQLLIILASVGGAGLALRIVRSRRDDEDKGSERII